MGVAAFVSAAWVGWFEVWRSISEHEVCEEGDCPIGYPEWAGIYAVLTFFAAALCVGIPAAGVQVLVTASDDQ